jgi:hypothetical protein
LSKFSTSIVLAGDANIPLRRPSIRDSPTVGRIRACHSRKFSRVNFSRQKWQSASALTKKMLMLWRFVEMPRLIKNYIMKDINTATEISRHLYPLL